MKLSDIKKTQTKAKKETKAKRGYFWDNPYKENSEDLKQTLKEYSSLENLQLISRESPEINDIKSREKIENSTFSRESPVIQSEILQRDSRESLERNTVLLYKVVGLQKRVLLSIFSILQSNGSRLSPPVAIEVIANRSNTTIGNTQNAIKELIKKNLLIRKDFQRGRGGWTIYEIEESIYSALDKDKIRESLENLQRFSRQQTSPITREIDSNSSCLSKDIKETTIKIPNEIKNLISLKEVMSLIEKQVLSEDDIKQSLEHFAYDFKNNLVKAKTSPINLLFGLIRSGRPYKSLKLLELENKELQEYQKQLQKLEEENKKLKQVELKEKYKEFKQKNPDFIKKIKEENQLIQSDEMADIVGFDKFLERQQE